MNSALHFILCLECGLPRVTPKAAAGNHYRCRPCRTIRERALRQRKEYRTVPPSVSPPITPAYKPIIIHSIGLTGQAHTCQFMGGMTQGPMCGKKTLSGQPYCQEHYDICHVKNKPYKFKRHKDAVYPRYTYGSD